MENNLFEIASRKAFRFPSARGELTVEQLWDLPLQSRSNFDLDSLARLANTALKAVTEESFVATTPNHAKAELEMKLELVKHIIAVKIAESKAISDRAAKADKRKKLIAALAQKEEQALGGMTKEEIEKELAALDA